MRARQRGLATLALVTGLFLLAVLAVLHLGRGLVLEQQGTRNQVAAAQAAEAADAALDWALARLSQGPLDDSCAPVDDHAAVPFATARSPLSERLGPAGAAGGEALCAWQGQAWRCSCPSPGTPADPDTLPAPAGDGPRPAFRVRAEVPAAAPPGVLRLRAVGCTVPDRACLADRGMAPPLEARATHSLVVALASALPHPPVAAVTVRGQVQADAGGLRAVQPAGSRTDVALVAGGSANGSRLEAVGPPGTPPAAARRAPAAAVPTDDTAFAAAFLAAWPGRWQRQPAVVEVACAPACDTAGVRGLAAAHPGRPLWLRGPARLEGTLGSPEAPLFVMADAPVEFGTAVLHGLLWLRDGALQARGAALVRGALVVEGDLTLTGGGTLTAVHDAAALERLRLGSGSWARVPGGWRDE